MRSPLVRPFSGQKTLSRLEGSTPPGMGKRYPRKQERLRDLGRAQDDPVEEVRVDTANDARDGDAVRVLPERPPVAAPVLARDRRGGDEPVCDPEQAVAILGERVCVAQVRLPERGARVDEGVDTRPVQDLFQEGPQP